MSKKGVLIIIAGLCVYGRLFNLTIKVSNATFNMLEGYYVSMLNYIGAENITDGKTSI